MAKPNSQNGWCDSDSLDEVHIIWCTEDVLAQAKEMNVKLTKKEARRILHDLKRHHDAQYGISWDSISNAIEGTHRSRGKVGMRGGSRE